MTNIDMDAATFFAEITEIAEARREEIGFDYVYEKEVYGVRTPRDADEVDSSCLYVHSDESGNAKPGCIIGTWLHVKHGVALEALKHAEGLAAGAAMSKVEFFVSGEVETAAEEVQGMQDVGTPWCTAVERAQASYR